jgi:hypothetical protein
MPRRTPPRLVLTLAIILAACQPFFSTAPTAIPTVSPGQTPVTTTPLAPSENRDYHAGTGTTSLTESPSPAETIEPSLPPTPTATPLPTALSLDPENWQHWPVIPIVPEYARQIYLLGQSLGNDPHAFSVFGDCQSEPNVFMGGYESNPALASGLPPDLQETVAWFSGSFNRSSPTVSGGTTPAALLWDQWHQNQYGCSPYETPVQCELRIHKPSLVIIQIGTHYETRNKDYMHTILDQLIAAGVVPILASKADNTELDMHINLQYAQLAAEYNIPFWNFWAAVQSLPEHGVYTSLDGPQYIGDLYLTEPAKVIHRLTALESLDSVWRAVTGR